MKSILWESELYDNVRRLGRCMVRLMGVVLMPWTSCSGWSLLESPWWPGVWASSLGESWDCYLFLLGLHAKCHLLFDPIWDLTEQGHAFPSEKARLATCTRGLVSAAGDLNSLRRWFLEMILLLHALPFCLDSVWYPYLIFPKIREVCSQLKTKENNHKS